MKRLMVVVIGAVALSAVGMYAQDKAAAQSVYTGCLVPGSGDSVTLVNATEKGQKDKAKINIAVVPESPKVDVKFFVTNEVEITGTVTGTGSKAVLTASKIKRRSDYCG